MWRAQEFMRREGGLSVKFLLVLASAVNIRGLNLTVVKLSTV
jgi:hypothetical protein